MPFSMRWFQIPYLILGTYFVGSALGKLGSLKEELTNIRRYYAWQRRQVSKSMIEDMQAYEHDDVVDQYEYVVASLFALGKVSSDDVIPIMNRFRDLCGDDGVIDLVAVSKSDEEDGNPEVVVEQSYSS